MRDAVLLSIVTRGAIMPDAQWIPAALRDHGAMNDGFRGACYERLFRMLHQDVGVRYGDFLRIERDAQGKPVMPPWRRDIHFNVSHADNCALVAISRAEVGVDIERVDACYRETLQEFLPASSCLRTGVTPFVAWVRYEAIAKLLGLGLRLDVDAIQASDSQMVAHGQPVWVCELSVPTGHVAAIASHQPVELIYWNET